MWRCILCRFEVVLDDAVVATAGGCCICLLCYVRNVDGQLRPMPSDYRAAVIAAANGAP